MLTSAHDDLVTDLAKYLRARSATTSARMPVIVTEVALEGAWSSKGRLDVVAFRAFKGYSSMALAGYEVKAERADLQRDLRTGKWRKYLPRLDRFYFAFPEGMARLSEIPPGPGVIVQLKSGGWRVVRASGIDRGTPTRGTLARLLYALDRPNDPRRQRYDPLAGGVGR